MDRVRVDGTIALCRRFHSPEGGSQRRQITRRELTPRLLGRVFTVVLAEPSPGAGSLLTHSPEEGCQRCRITRG